MATPITPALSFERLVTAIGQVNAELAAQASRAVNTSLTLRNWFIGCYITEYELRGADRAQYGDKIFELLSERLMQAGVSRSEMRELRRYRQFYLTYPSIRESLTPELKNKLLPADTFNFRETASPVLGIAPAELLGKLSFTHIAELLQCEDETKRLFYEVECIQGNWSVRELRRQIHSLFYERCGLSIDKKKLMEQAQKNAEKALPTLTVRDPYLFEFLGLTPREVMSESHLEDQLINKIEEFLLELGHGFCFEARQRRILIGDDYYFVDLVFYHRILKCHVLVELKLAEFSHENIGQLNTYVSWYRKTMMREGDNPPIGILLCTHKKHSLVEFALAGIDNQLFVSKYLLELPKKEEMLRFIEEQLAPEALGESEVRRTPEIEPPANKGGN